MTTHPRQSIYYWKCDRPAAFHGTHERTRDDASVMAALSEVLRDAFSGSTVTLRPAASQGNHLTFIVTIDGHERFVRVEDGPESDDYLEVESMVMTAVRGLGVSTPQILAVDASRRVVPFAWQVMEKVPFPDLNQHYKTGCLDLPVVAEKIGAAVATWQGLPVTGFGPFDPRALSLNPQQDSESRAGAVAGLCEAGPERRGEPPGPGWKPSGTGRGTAEIRHASGLAEPGYSQPLDGLQGFHAAYADYFHLNLDRHLCFLRDRGFLSNIEKQAMEAAVSRHHSLLELKTGCLVHKDLALWNILGSETEIAAFIDFDDTIAGDPMDDLSLLACFHEPPIIERALEGYASVRALPEHHERRLALHLLRNMIVKAVIRVGAGYFDRTDGFFLIGTGGSGADLRTFTKERLATALKALQ